MRKSPLLPARGTFTLQLAREYPIKSRPDAFLRITHRRNSNILPCCPRFHHDNVQSDIHVRPHLLYPESTAEDAAVRIPSIVYGFDTYERLENFLH